MNYVLLALPSRDRQKNRHKQNSFFIVISCKIYFSLAHLHKYKTAHLINIGQYAVTARVGSNGKQSSIKILNIGKLSVPQ